MEKQKILLQINNQCAAVQKSIAKNYENPHNEELRFELSKLYSFLDNFLAGQPKI